MSTEYITRGFFPTAHILLKRAESLSVNILTRQIAQEEILNNQRRESFKSYKIAIVTTSISGLQQCCHYLSNALVSEFDQ